MSEEQVATLERKHAAEQAAREEAEKVTTFCSAKKIKLLHENGPRNIDLIDFLNLSLCDLGLSLAILLKPSQRHSQLHKQTNSQLLLLSALLP